MNPGTIVSQSYMILECVGEGGSGTVYRAMDTELRREIALKFLHESLVATPESTERFAREGRILSGINHLNIATFYKTGTDQNNLPYISMEFIKGRSLHSILSDGKLPWEKAIEYGMQMCLALAEIHRVGIVHRDIKPANFMLTQTGVIKLVDFGLARSPGMETLTDTGILVGTVQYMSPEACQGRRADNRSDIYSLGCALYAMIYGAPPFEADSPVGVLFLHAHKSPAFIVDRAEIPIAMVAIIGKCLKKDPGDRYQAAEEIFQELKAVQLEPGPFQKACRQSIPSIKIAVLAIVLLFSGVVFLVPSFGARIVMLPVLGGSNPQVMTYAISAADVAQRFGMANYTSELLETAQQNADEPQSQAELSARIAQLALTQGNKDEALYYARRALSVIANPSSRTGRDIVQLSGPEAPNPLAAIVHDALAHGVPAREPPRTIENPRIKVDGKRIALTIRQACEVFETLRDSAGQLRISATEYVSLFTGVSDTCARNGCSESAVPALLLRAELQYPEDKSAYSLTMLRVAEMLESSGGSVNAISAYARRGLEVASSLEDQTQLQRAILSFMAQCLPRTDLQKYSAFRNLSDFDKAQAFCIQANALVGEGLFQERREKLTAAMEVARRLTQKNKRLFSKLVLPSILTRFTYIKGASLLPDPLVDLQVVKELMSWQDRCDEAEYNWNLAAWVAYRAHHKFRTAYRYLKKAENLVQSSNVSVARKLDSKLGHVGFLIYIGEKEEARRWLQECHILFAVFQRGDRSEDNNFEKRFRFHESHLGENQGPYPGLVDYTRLTDKGKW